MSLGLILAVLMLVILAGSAGLLYYTSVFIQSHLALFIPDTSSAEYAAIHQLFIQQIALVGIGEILIVLLAFILIGSLVVSPLRQLAKAIANFTEDFTVALPPFSGMVPSEVHSIAAAFQTFSARVSEAHQKDQEISRVKSDFISTVAHQLRTPLTGIRWALEALEKEPITPEQLQIVESAVTKSHDLVAIVGTLLDISSIESGKFKYAFVQFDLSELVSEVAKDLEPMAQKAGITFYYAKEEAPLPLVYGDRDRLKWVLNNLVENAIRYTPSPGSVHISTDATALRVNVRVRDTGIGIQEEDKGNIFERFYRGENARAKENQGNGLGLYIARTIAKDHGGDLNFMANEEGPGTTFVLSLPVASEVAGQGM